jgi:mono/diheme cytochrome c family protein
MIAIAALAAAGEHPPGDPIVLFSPSPAGTGLSPMLIVGVVALGLAVFGFVLRADLRARFPRRAGLLTGATWLAGILGVAFTLGALSESPAATVPTNPVPLTVDSIAAGRGLYEQTCAACHGVSARGGGPDAFTTQVPPADLLSGHLDQHSDGDIYTWISGGLPGGMPAWQGKLSEAQMWDLVNFLRAINTGQATVEGPTIAPAASPSGPGPASPSPSLATP